MSFAANTAFLITGTSSGRLMGSGDILWILKPTQVLFGTFTVGRLIYPFSVSVFKLIGSGVINL